MLKTPTGKEFAAAVTFALSLIIAPQAQATERQAERYFEEVRQEPAFLRPFLADFPKGGDLHSHLSGAVYGERFLAWARTAKDVGGTISAALTRYRALDDWPKASSATPQAMTGKAAGNGSLMRTLPVALAYSEPSAMLRRSASIRNESGWPVMAPKPLSAPLIAS